MPTLACETCGFKAWTNLVESPWVEVVGGPPRKLTILTYNVWFDNFYKHERYLVIMRILQQSDADFICLQEVTEDFKALLMAEDWAKKKYFVSGSSMFTFYGVLIMSKWPCKF